MLNINKNDYYYYLHKTNILSAEKIESFFNEGLKSDYDYNMHSTLQPIDEKLLETKGLHQTIINYLGDSNDYNSVVVIKVPKRYMSRILHRDGNIDPTIPLYRSFDGYDSEFSTAFTPNLIQGVYCRDIDKAFTNPNFNPVFDPSGLQFADEQIMNLNFFNLYNLTNSLKERRKIPFQKLYIYDKNSNRWDKIVDYYSKLYGVLPKKMIVYKMPETDKNLFPLKKL